MWGVGVKLLLYVYFCYFAKEIAVNIMHYIYSLYHFFPYVIAWGKRIKWEKCEEDSLVEIVKHGDAKKCGGRGKGHYRNTYFGFFFTNIAIWLIH